jgi:hypothetical protein
LKPSLVPPQIGSALTTGFRPQAAATREGSPDQLFIRWNNLPRDSVVTVYLPGADVTQLLDYAALRPGAGSIVAIDQHTLLLRVGDATYLPLRASGPPICRDY